MRCETDGCSFLAHANVEVIGGSHCCNACKKKEGRHGPMCEKKAVPPREMKPRIMSVNPFRAKVPHVGGRPWFLPTELAQIYGFPSVPTGKTVIGVFSFGGGLYGTVNSSGVLTNGDVQKYWLNNCGIASNNLPTVVIVPVDGAKNTPDVNDSGATHENTLDVQTIGGCYPSSNLTIILYLGKPNSLFAKLVAASETAVAVNSVLHKPSIISISWGLAETYFTSAELVSENAAFARLSAAGVTICTATGDYGSNNGVGGTGNYADFPSTSPFVTAVGGTSLVSKTTTYGPAPDTVETAWSYGGGGVSDFFQKPNWQSAIVGKGRSIPDIALNSDPKTGVYYLTNNTGYIFGGTSVAAPMAAAYFALNKVNKFINPTLYTAPRDCYNDILIGSNGGFSCAVGYDNCTGCGSINGANLNKLLAGTPLPPPITGNALTSISIPYAVGIKYTIVPLLAAASNLTWSTSNSQVATVDSNGVLSGVAVGTTTVICSSSNNSVTLPVTIVARVPVTSIAVSTTASKIRPKGSQVRLTALVSPVTATNKVITWVSSSNAIATVDNTGNVTSKLAGRVTISCVSVDNNSIIGNIILTFT